MKSTARARRARRRVATRATPARGARAVARGDVGAIARASADGRYVRRRRAPRRAMATRDAADAREATRAEFWLTIPRATRRPDPTRAGRETIFYDVACALHGDRDGRARVERVARRRYREFVALKEDLDEECGRGMAPEPPPRERFRRVNADEGKVEARRRRLERWLWGVLANETCAKSEALGRFVRLGACERALRRAEAKAVDGGDVGGTPAATPETAPAATPETAPETPESANASTPESETRAWASRWRAGDARGAEAVGADAAPRVTNEEMRRVEEELDATKECLKDARATAAAAEGKLVDVEAASRKEKKVLSKEIRALRRQLEEAKLDKNERANIVSAEDRTAALRDVMHEVGVLRNRVQECTYEKLLSVEASSRHGHADGDPNELLAVSDNRLAVLLAETQIMILGVEDAQPPASDSPESAEAEQELLNAERETRQMFADLLSDLINTRKSINSLLRKNFARKNEPASTSGLSSRVTNLVGAIEKKLTIPQ